MAASSDGNGTTLARSIGPGLLLVMVIGNVLGAGIYVVTGEVTGEMGAQAWLAFAVAFAVAAVSALSLCELVTKYPGAAGVALYVDRAFGRSTLTFAVGLAVLASGMTSAATAARAFGGEYLAELVTFDTAVAAVGFVVVLSAVNYWGVLLSMRANLVMTAIEVVGLGLVIAAAMTLLAAGDGEATRPLREGAGDRIVPLALLSGAAIAFFSFLGFEDVANLSEEVRRPNRAYPVALFGGLGVTAVLYLGVVYLANAAVAPERLAESSGPLLVVVEDSSLGLSAKTFAFIALVAVANTALANLVMSSRLLYGMAVRGLLPRTLRHIDRRRATPSLAVGVAGALTIALSASGDLGGLARTTVLLLLSVLVLMNLSAIRLRADAVGHSHFSAPVWAPWLGAASCVVLVGNQVITGSPVDLARGGVIIGAGLLTYLLVRRGAGDSALPQGESGRSATAGALPPDEVRGRSADTHSKRSG